MRFCIEDTYLKTRFVGPTETDPRRPADRSLGLS